MYSLQKKKKKHKPIIDEDYELFLSHLDSSSEQVCTNANSVTYFFIFKIKFQYLRDIKMTHDPWIHNETSLVPKTFQN